MTFKLFPFVCARAVFNNGDIYVALQGNGSSDGSQDRSFATLERGQAAVRHINGHLIGDLYDHVAAGTYYLDMPLNFTSVDSVSNGHRIISRADEVQWWIKHFRRASITTQHRLVMMG